MRLSLPIAAAAATLALAAAPAHAQSSGTTAEPSSSRQQDRIGQILGALFGGGTNGSTASIEAQWTAGRTPLATQRAEFETRVDTDVRNGSLSQTTGARLKSDYYELVQLERRYGADRRFTTQERTELADRYGALTQVLADGAYGDDAGTGNDDGNRSSIADERAEFFRRIDVAVAERRITRSEATRLRVDYNALARLETSYLRDGAISARERDDLDTRLDALNRRVGDDAYGGGQVAQTPRERLDAIARALPASGLTTAAQAQLRVEHEDLTRLEAAYARLSVTADDRAYLDRRLADLETRARVRR